MKSIIHERIEGNLNTANDRILFILQNKKTSFDNDYYCVFAGSSISKALMFTDENGVWNEIFVDNEEDLSHKLDNFDEIIINFLTQMTFIEGNVEVYNKYKELGFKKKENFIYPPERLWALKYRIKTLYSKYINYHEKGDELQSRFILNALSYPFLQLILVSNYIVPDSPKYWVSQLKKTLSDEEYGVISSLIDTFISLEKLHFIFAKYVGELDDKTLCKNKNSLTFIN